MAKFKFNASKHDPIGPMGIIPAGDYHVVIVKTEKKQNKKKTGQLLKLNLKIIEGEYKGRILFDQLNIKHEKEEAQLMGLGQLSAICAAIGIDGFSVTEELHDQPLCCVVGVQSGTQDYPDPQNRVLGYKPIEGEEGEEEEDEDEDEGEDEDEDEEGEEEEDEDEDEGEDEDEDEEGEEEEDEDEGEDEDEDEDEVTELPWNKKKKPATKKKAAKKSAATKKTSKKAAAKKPTVKKSKRKK